MLSGENRVFITGVNTIALRLRRIFFCNKRFVLREYLPLDGGAQLTVEAHIELEGSGKPACIAETISRRYT